MSLSVVSIVATLTGCNSVCVSYSEWNTEVHREIKGRLTEVESSGTGAVDGCIGVSTATIQHVSLCAAIFHIGSSVLFGRL